MWDTGWMGGRGRIWRWEGMLGSREGSGKGGLRGDKGRRAMRGQVRDGEGR